MALRGFGYESHKGQEMNIYFFCVCVIHTLSLGAKLEFSYINCAIIIVAQVVDIGNTSPSKQGENFGLRCTCVKEEH